MLIAAIFLVIAGFQGIREAGSFKKPVDMPCSAFVKSPPQEGWFRIKGCHMELADAAFTVLKRRGSELKTEDGDPVVSDVYLPVHCPDEPVSPNGKPSAVTLLLKTEDDAIIETIKEMNRLDEGDEKKAEEWVLKNKERFFLDKDLMGMIETGINSSESTRKEISALQGSLAPNFVILEEGKTPSMGGAIGMFVGGIVLLLVSLLYGASIFFGRGKKE